MSDANSQGEPTMEEILASIRKIIAEDGPEAEGKDEAAAEAEAAPEPEPEAEAEPEPAPAPEPEPEPEPEPAAEDVLDLTQVVHEDGTVVDLNAERAAAGRQDDAESESEPADELSLDDVAESEPDAPAENAEPAETVSEPVAEVPDEGIVSPPTRTAATASLLDLARNMGPGENPDLATLGGGMTLEVLVRDSLRPYLKAWLDEHLATLVERIVREEIQKMVKRAEYR